MAFIDDSKIRDFWKRSEHPVKLKVSYTLPPIEHPIHGSTRSTTCEFPLFLSSNYPISNYFDLTSEEQEEIVCSAISRLRPLFKTLDEATTRKKLHLLVYSTACIMPQIDAQSKHFEIATDFSALVYENDDTFERVAATYDKAYLTQLIVNSKIMSNVYESCSTYRNLVADKIARQLPEMEPLANTLCATLNSFVTIYPKGIPKGLQHFFHSHKRTLQAALLKYNKSLTENYSESTLEVVRGADVAGNGLLEIYALLQKCSVPKHIRKSLLFELLLAGEANFTAATNDMFGLMKDMNHEDAVSNVIIRRVVQDGISLEESFKHEGKRLNSIVSDMRLTMQKLEDAFTNDDLRAYLEIVKGFCDGQILMYCLEANRYNYRYGGLQMEVVEDGTP